MTMKGRCIYFRCIHCCKDTEMPLLNSDIERIEGLGFSPDFFVDTHDGWLLLKNRDGRCVFHTGVICSIYDDRPEGCKLYPLIYDADTKSATIDEECPHRTDFLLSQRSRKKLLHIVSRIKSERFLRLKCRSYNNDPAEDS